MVYWGPRLYGFRRQLVYLKASVGRFVGRFVVLSDRHTVWILDHTPWDGDHPRGSSAKVGQVDVSYKYKRVDDFDRDHLGSVMIQAYKDREAMMPYKQKYVMGGQNGRLVCYPEGIIDDGGQRIGGRDLEVLDALRNHGQPAGNNEWRNLAGIKSKSGFQAIRDRLVDEGFVRPDDDGKYVPAEMVNQMALGTDPD